MVTDINIRSTKKSCRPFPVVLNGILSLRTINWSDNPNSRCRDDKWRWFKVSNIINYIFSMKGPLLWLKWVNSILFIQFTWQDCFGTLDGTFLPVSQLMLKVDIQIENHNCQKCFRSLWSWHEVCLCATWIGGFDNCF